MPADLALRAPAVTGRSPGRVVLDQTGRRAARSGALWGAVFGLYVASSALGYASSYPTAAQRDRLAATFGSNAAVSALFGPGREIQTVAGYTVWKSLGALAIVGAVWALLVATKSLRGEEDAGRWELLLAGQTTRRGAAAQALGGLGVGLVALWAVTALVTVAVGRSSKVHVAAGPALFFALTIVAPAAVFLAAGALTSQLAATRRQAAAYAGAALGVAYALRMVADSGAGLEWLRWTTPLGWVEELQPLTAPRPWALVPTAALVLVLCASTVHLAGRRDLGAATFGDRALTAPRTRLLNGPTGLTVRLVGPTVLAWTGAIAAMSVLVGFIAKTGGQALATSASVEKVLARLGAPGVGPATYLGLCFLVVAVLLALLAAGQVSAARSEEAEGRLEHLLVRPVSRPSWLTGRVGVAALALVAAGLVAGLAAWLGAASQHTGLGFTAVLGAGLNLVPPALCVLGAGVLGLGVWPRAASGFAYGLLAWSLLVELVGGFVASNRWLLDTSVFHQMAAAPAVHPDVTSAAVMAALAALAALAGGVAFTRRDLAGE
ncbi:MAG TPA: ABC transporter permease subunit [Acidimicrobiales bacterium]|nr:ABC transporter permease subunit [Acidimicrobiales bacterium]